METAQAQRVKKVLLAINDANLSLKVRGDEVVALPRKKLTKKLQRDLKAVTPDLLHVHRICVAACEDLEIPTDDLFSELMPTDFALLIAGDFGLDDLREYAE
jgi:hypothetical protein